MDATPPRSGRSMMGWVHGMSLVLLTIAMPLSASAAVAPERQAFEAPLRQSLAEYAPDKQALIKYSMRMRQKPDIALTGLPGAPVVVIRCIGKACANARSARLSGGRVGPRVQQQLTHEISQFRASVLAVDGPRGGIAQLRWDGQSGAQSVPLPKAGTVTDVVLTNDGAQITTDVAITQDHVRLAAQLARHRGDRLGAIAGIEAWRSTRPKLSPANQLLLADLYREAGIPLQAGALYQHLAANYSDNYRVLALIGQARLELAAERWKVALRALSPVRLPKEHPLVGTVYNLRTYAFVGLEQVGDISQEVPQAGVDPFALVNRAAAFHQAGDPFSAIGLLREAERRLHANLAEEVYLRERILVALGTLYAEQGQMEKAIETFGRMNTIGPFADRFRFARGLAFFKHEDMVNAVAEFQALAQERPTSPYAAEGRLVMADAYRKLNAPRQAMNIYRGALEDFQGRLRAIDLLLDDLQASPFDEGVTELLFGGGDSPSKPVYQGAGLEVLFRTPDLAIIYDDIAQIQLIQRRLQAQNKRWTALKDTRGTNNVAAAKVKLEEYRSRFEKAAAKELVRVLKLERERVEALSVSASLGVTQSVLSDQKGLAARGLVFP